MNISMRSALITALLTLTVALGANRSIAADDQAVVETGKQIAFLYTLKSDGEVVESNTEETPVTYVQGSNQILPALEAELGRPIESDGDLFVGVFQ